MRLQIRWSHLWSVNNVSASSEAVCALHGQRGESSDTQVCEADSWDLTWSSA